MIPLRRSQRRQNAHIKSCVAGGLAKKDAAANSCKLARPKRCKKVCVVAKRRQPSAPANSSTSPEIAERHDKAALISVEKVVDLRLTDRLLKGDAGEHFERRGRESRTRVRASLFA